MFKLLYVLLIELPKALIMGLLAIFKIIPPAVHSMEKVATYMNDELGELEKRSKAELESVQKNADELKTIANAKMRAEINKKRQELGLPPKT